MDDKGSKGGRTRRAAEKAPAAASRSTAAAKPAAAAVAVAAAPKKVAAPRKAAAAPVAAQAQAPAAARAAGPDRVDLVRIAAYFRAERRGFVPGYEVEDWLAAEAEVAAKGAAGKAAARKPAAG